MRPPAAPKMPNQQNETPHGRKPPLPTSTSCDPSTWASAGRRRGHGRSTQERQGRNKRKLAQGSLSRFRVWQFKNVWFPDVGKFELEFGISGSGFGAGGFVEVRRVRQVKFMRRLHPRHRFWNYRVMSFWRDMKEAALWLPLLAPGPPKARSHSPTSGSAERRPEPRSSRACKQNHEKWGLKAWPVCKGEFGVCLVWV